MTQDYLDLTPRMEEKRVHAAPEAPKELVKVVEEVEEVPKEPIAVEPVKTSLLCRRRSVIQSLVLCRPPNRFQRRNQPRYASVLMDISEDTVVIPTSLAPGSVPTSSQQFA